MGFTVAASIDQSFQIEPSQVAGFNQSFRSVIPESVAAANAGAEFETFDLSLEHKFPTETYVGISGEILNSQVHRRVGALGFDTTGPIVPFPVYGASLRENLDFTEQSALLTINQLIGQGWSLGATYRISRADLSDLYPQFQLPGPAGFRPRSFYESTLQQSTLYAIYNHPCGWFCNLQAIWNEQWNERGSSSEKNDRFWQLNAFTGYRFWRRHAEASVGVVNITDEDYRLDPLTLYTELPRERTFVARFNFKF